MRSPENKLWCVYNDIDYNPWGGGISFYVKVDLIQSMAHCTTKAVDLSRNSVLVDDHSIIEYDDLSSCQNSDFDLKQSSVEIKLHFTRKFSGDQLWESL